MALIKEGYWGIVNKTETAPDGADARQKFMTRRGKALALIGLTVDPSLLYLIGNEDHPCKVWETLQGQFQHKTWSNKLQFRKKLITLKLKEGGSMNAHVKEITETFESLSIVDAPVSEEDRVVYLLASLPDSYNMIVTALETQSESVPKWSLLTEMLLHQEAIMKEKDAQEGETKKALSASSQQKRRKSNRLSSAIFAERLDTSNVIAKSSWPLIVKGNNPLTQPNPNRPETTSL